MKLIRLKIIPPILVGEWVAVLLQTLTKTFKYPIIKTRQ
jgi:hypothetical protein